MKKNIESEIKRLILEVCLVVVFTIVSIPLWDYVSNPTYAEVAKHYSSMEMSDVSVTNSKKYIYSETFEESIGEMNMAFITSYEDDSKEFDIYLLLELNTNFDDIMFSNGTEITELKELYDKTSDYIYFKIDSKTLNSKETVIYNYYLWTKNLNKDKNVKIKFAVL